MRGARLAVRICAAATVLVPAATALVGSTLVRQAAVPPPVVAVTASGRAFAAEPMPFRPDDIMIDAWLAELVRDLAAVPAEVVRSSRASAEAAAAWSEAGPAQAILGERRVRSVDVSSIRVEARIEWHPAGRLPDERFARLEIARVPYDRSNPLGLRLVGMTWINASVFDEPERRAAWARHLGGGES